MSLKQEKKITRQQLKEQAIVLFNDPHFKASKAWQDEFIKNNDVKFFVLEMLNDRQLLNPFQTKKFIQYKEKRQLKLAEQPKQEKKEKKEEEEEKQQEQAYHSDDDQQQQLGTVKVEMQQCQKKREFECFDQDWFYEGDCECIRQYSPEYEGVKYEDENIFQGYLDESQVL